MKHYTPIKEGNRYTIGEYDEDYKAYIINDGICRFYWWNSRDDAQAAADAYNAYNGLEWLGQHGYGNDFIHSDEADTSDQDMIDLYQLFGATDF